MKILKTIIAAPLLLFWLSGNAFFTPPSFACEKAQSPAEKAICSPKHENRETVRKLDTTLSKIYSITHEKPGVKERQRQWLKQRNSCVQTEAYKTTDCLISSYNERIKSLLRFQLSSPSTLSAENICQKLMHETCNKNSPVEFFPIGKGHAFFFTSSRFQSHLIIVDAHGNIDWASSWTGTIIDTGKYFSPDRESYWSPKSKALEEYILINRGYRYGCPDCGHQDIIFVRNAGSWAPLNLIHFYRLFSNVATSTNEIYMSVNKSSGQITIRAAFSDYKESDGEPLSDFTSVGQLKDGVFIPSSVVVEIN